MYVAKIIGTDIEVVSSNMIEAYNVVSEFAPVNARISMKWIGNKSNW